MKSENTQSENTQFRNTQSQNTQSLPSKQPVGIPPNRPGVESLWRDHYPSMVAAAQTRTRRRDLAEEAAQESILRFIERDYQPRAGSEGAYLRRMAINFANTTIRRRGIEERVIERRQDTHASAEHEAIERVASAELRELILRLPVQQQRVVMRRHLGGSSVKDVAAELGLSSGAVKTHTHRACTTLQKSLLEAA